MRSIQQLLMLYALLLLSACGGGGGGGGHGNSSVLPTPNPSGSNVVAIHVNGGPLPYPSDTINLAYTTITICEPGGSNCQTLDNIVIDTGSTGLRVLSSALTSLNLQAATNGSGIPLFECVRFLDTSHVWGPMKTADVKIGGETASSIPIQLIGNPSGITEPQECNGGDVASNLDTQIKLGANGILGIGIFQQDCGDCLIPSANPYIHWPYFICNGATCSRSGAPLTSQALNPIAAFATDNNGSIIQLPPAAATGSASLDGWLIFGIDTQSNNARGTRPVIAVDNTDEFTTMFQGQQIYYSFVDSGSNALYFPNVSAPTITECTNFVGFYCPSAARDFTATLVGAGNNSNSSNAAFTVINAEMIPIGLHAIGGLAAVSQANNTLYSGFDWGLPFFFGRSVYTALETNPEGPYIAF